MEGPQLPSNDSDRIFHCFVFFFFFFFFFFFVNLPLLSHLLVVVFWLSHVRLFANLWTVAHQAPLSMGFPRPKKRKARFWERVHGQRPLRTQGWKGLPGGDEGQKTSLYVRSGQETWLPGLAVDTAQHPSDCPLSVLPHIC